MIGPSPEQAPTIVMLHEGLGSVGLWGDFPEKLQAATGAGVFVYSRAGYGASTPAKLPRPLDYMHTEALDVLPKLLDAIGFRRGLLLGHSDGASIAAIYAGSRQDHRVEGIALIAPAFHRRGYFGRVDRRDQDGLRDHEPERETLALAQGRRQRLLRLERRLARSEIPRLGYFRVSRLYPGAGRDRAGCGGPVRHHASGRDRAGGMLLPGRCRGHRQMPATPRIARRRSRRWRRLPISRRRCCVPTGHWRPERPSATASPLAERPFQRT